MSLQLENMEVQPFPVEQELKKQVLFAGFKCFEPENQSVALIDSGPGKDIVLSILIFMEENCMDEKSIKAFGCDGTATNTGASNGSLELFKNAFKHPLEAVGCLIHSFLEDDD
ncbi:hypothetical protein AVEN_26062-1 [Araneus ventricosus]|uniref:Uncharacterized protein n=1 Tax=Araneus ventricosus TaxID=182803 RepID=A0A4Y2HXZ1_ARAVE|nr:hypothetical protein AVEN_26062-1 [Araneus ventricosus]